MNSYVLEYKTSAPFERPDQWCVYVMVEIHEQTAGARARLWSRRFQGTDWMQSPSLEDTRQGPDIELASTDACNVLGLLRTAQVGMVPQEYPAFHPTTHTLKVSSFFSNLTLVWLDELPAQWAGLEELVRTLDGLAARYSTCA
ncbi:hypothetical protein [Rhizobacter sp. LjRoot28]|uniref:hypothetical protein n=1 Tax=Rhizobacter sp. LjRoot28 TaxID=3342309 RepID=UPI003ECD0BCA